jgi:outer membrane protein
MEWKRYVFGLFMIFGCSGVVFAQDSTTTKYPERDWGIGVAIRSATVPYFSEDENNTNSIVPLIWYDSDIFFWNGVGGGFKLYNREFWQLSLMIRMRFVDIPLDYQNEVMGATSDFGFQYRYNFTDLYYSDFELLLDWEKNFSSNLRFGIHYETQRINLRSWFQVRYKSTDFNSYYYGLTREKISAGIELSLGMRIYYQLWRNLYLFGAFEVTRIDKNAQSAEFVRDRYRGEVWAGFGFSNDKGKVKKDDLRISPYIRLAHGWATPSDLMDIIVFNFERDTFNNQMTSVFYGLPLTDDVFGIPLDLYLVSGFAWHWPSSVQRSAQELILGMKADFMIKWPIRWRIGLGEGFSWINRITYIEQQELDRKPFKSSNLLNYIDYTIDFFLGDIFGGELMQHLWLGYSIHHRSGIFSNSQQFARINGGSNYQCFYLQYHFR